MILGVVFVFGTLLTWFVVVQADHEMRADLLWQTRLVAQAVPYEQLKALSGTVADLDNPIYQRLKSNLSSVCSSIPYCRSVYLLGRNPEGKIFFFADSDPVGSKNYSPPGQLYKEATAGRFRTLATRTEGVEGPFTDRWGRWISGMAPITDPRTALYGLAVPEDAKAMVKNAVSFYHTHGKKKVLEEINNPKGEFCKGPDLYTFAYDRNMTWLAHPLTPERIGENWIDKKDWSGGKYFRREIQEVAGSRKGEGWVEFEYVNPINKQRDLKTSYICGVDDLIICAGTYKGDGQILGMLGLDVNAHEWNLRLARAAIPPVLLTLVLALILIICKVLMKRRSLRGVDDPQWGRALEAATAIAICLILTLYFSWLLYEREIYKRKEAFCGLGIQRTELIANAVRTALLPQLDGVARFCTDALTLKQDEFQKFINYLVSNPCVQAWEWIPAISAADKSRFEEESRASGLTGFAIWQRDNKGNREPVAGREFYYPVACVSPILRNERAMGFDLGSDPIRRAALEEAARTGLTVGTDPITLVQETSHQKGMLVYRAVFDSKNQLRGFALVVLRMGTLMRSVGSDSLASMEISYLPKDAPPESLAIAWNPDFPPSNEISLSRPIFAYGKVFAVKVHPGTEFIREYHQVWAAALGGVVGLLLTVCLAVVIQVLLRRRDNLERLVAERTAALLRESEEHLSATLRSIGDGVIACDVEGRIVNLNLVAQTLTGWPLDEAKGRPISEVFRIVHAKTRLEVEIPTFRAISEDRSIDLANHTVLIARDGFERHIADSCAPIHAATAEVIGAVLVFHDVSTEYRQREELRESEIIQRTLLNNLPAGVIIVDPTSRMIEQANDYSAQLLGTKVEHLVGHRCHSVMCPAAENACPICDLGQTVDNSERVAVRGDGSRLSILKTIKRIELKGHEKLLECFVDISALKKAEADLRNYEHQLQQSQKLESIGNLAAGIAHEINTPIQFILTNVQFIHAAYPILEGMRHRCQELIERFHAGTLSREFVVGIEETAEADQVQYLASEVLPAIESSQEGVDRVRKIVRAMKEFSHPGGDKPALTDLNAAITSTITVSRSEWKHVAELVTCFAPELPLVPCFSSEINQVILNLLVNASHAIGERVKARRLAGEEVMGTITVTTRTDGAWAEILVSDTGNGIPEAVQSKIFEPFFTTKEVGKGTGLGLSISHAIIEKKHGGRITFETEAGEGTTFTIRLPLTREESGIEKLKQFY